MSHQNSFCIFQRDVRIWQSLPLWWNNQVLWFNPRQQPSTTCCLPTSSSPQWMREESGKKNKSHGLRWEQYNNWNKVKYHKNSNKKKREIKTQEEQLIHISIAHHSLTDAKRVPKLQSAPLLGDSLSRVNWAWCSMIWNIPLASSSHLFWPSFSHFLVLLTARAWKMEMSLT